MNFKTSSVKVILVLTFAVSCSIFTVSAQKNRYGMVLSGSEGNYTLKDSAKICPLIVGGCAALPADAFTVLPGYKPNLIIEKDYTQCTTLKFTYKTYDTYSLSMEVDIPKQATGPHPFIIWVHGGGWVNGSLTSFKNQSTYLATRGIAGVRISYSLMSQGGTFNQGKQEMADAFTFVQAHAAEWGLDMTRFGYAGGSAGTPLASLAAMKHNGNGCKLFIGCNGIYDFTSNLQGSFGRSSPYLKEYPIQESRDVISAIHNIPEKASNVPAVVAFHGTADFTISYLQSVALCDAVLKKGGRAEKNIYENYVHAFYNKGNSDRFEDITLKMYAFASSVFKIPEVQSGSSEPSFKNTNNLRTALLPVPREAIFKMEGYYLWDPSVIKVGNTYHLFASRWPAANGMIGWKKSHIIRATSQSLFGPYKFAEVVFEPKNHPWATEGMHNPKITIVGKRFLLYHLGIPAWKTGFLFADNIEGPWTPVKEPVISTNNPALVVKPDAKIYVVGKFKPKPVNDGKWDAYMQAFEADDIMGLYKLVGDAGNRLPNNYELEDPTIWWANNQYNVICTDWEAKVTNIEKSVVYYTSKDGINYKLYSNVPVWSQKDTIPLVGGENHIVRGVERPQVYIDNKGRMTALLVSVYPQDKEVPTYIIIRPVDKFIPANE
jgi:acetyl esterase/lipase